MVSKRTSIVVFIGLALIAGVAMVSKVRQSPELHGRVVEEGGTTPVPGAVIVASWRVVSTPHALPVRYLRLLETTSDESGNFVLPAWGPVLEMGSLAADQPKIEVFRTGYLPSTAFIHARSATRDAPTLLELSRYRGPPEEYAHILLLYAESVVSNYAMPPFHCEWRRIPAFIEAMQSAVHSLSEVAGSTSFHAKPLSFDVAECAGAIQ
jgi:hypothetical protein